MARGVRAVACLALLACASGNVKVDFEGRMAGFYNDRGQVLNKTVEVSSYGSIFYREAGPSDGRAVVFCHGAQFSSFTWQVTNVLDNLSDAGFRALAVDLPGYAQSSEAAGPQTGFLRAFLQAVGAVQAGSGGSRVLVVTASMGGNFGLPFVLEDNGQSTAGYVTVGGVTKVLAESPGVVLDTPALVIYGRHDPLLKSRSPRDHKITFPNSEQVVFDGAPHPAYVKDVASAQRFCELVLKFAKGEGTPSARWQAGNTDL